MRLPHRALILFSILLSAGSCRRAPERTITASPTPGAPVIVISIDTLRADRLPSWGYKGVATPAIDQLRADAILFENAYSHVPLTLPSHLSLLTGLLPAKHGVRDNLGYRFDAALPNLPQALRASGYATGAAVSAYVLRSGTGIGSMFDWYDDGIAFAPGADLGAIQRRGSETAAAASRWIAQQKETPFFLLLHVFEPHTPYDAPEPFRSAGADAYDGEIAYTDSIVGAFLDDLRKSGVYDRATIILLSDHGEGLGDHGEQEHGIFLYREAIHVPLLIKLPNGQQAGATVSDPVGLVDIMPTVLALTAVRNGAATDGVALLQQGASSPRARSIFAETLYPRLHLGWSDLRAAVNVTHHYIEAPRAELYSLESDPGQKKNILADERRVAAAFRAELEKLPRNLSAPSAVSAEEAAKLAALGYVSAPATSAEGALPDPKDGIDQLDLYGAGREALARGDARAAIGPLRALLEKNPNFTDGVLMLARAYERERRFAEAIEIYRGLLSRNPALTEQVAIGVATAFMNSGRLDDARRHAELALGANPGGAHLLLGRIALEAKNPADAVRHGREAARDESYRAAGVVMTAEALLASGDAEGALRELNALEASAPAPIRGAGNVRASALMRIGRADEAVAALQAEITAFPDSRDAYGSLAAIHLLKGDAAAADAVFESMLRQHPGPETHALASRTFAHFRQPELAARWRARGVANESTR